MLDSNVASNRPLKKEELILAKQNTDETSSHLRAVTVKVEQLEPIVEEPQEGPDPQETKLISQKILSAIQRE